MENEDQDRQAEIDKHDLKSLITPTAYEDEILVEPLASDNYLLTPRGGSARRAFEVLNEWMRGLIRS